jgi:hypothetical protein
MPADAPPDAGDGEAEPEGVPDGLLRRSSAATSNPESGRSGGSRNVLSDR